MTQGHLSLARDQRRGHKTAAATGTTTGTTTAGRTIAGSAGLPGLHHGGHRGHGGPLAIVTLAAGDAAATSPSFSWERPPGTRRTRPGRPFKRALSCQSCQSCNRPSCCCLSAVLLSASPNREPSLGGIVATAVSPTHA